ncbi:hypothetical protein GCM10029992_33460 [Glycomyces albus]
MESDRKPTLGRRGLLLGAAGAGAAAALGTAAPARAAIPGFPEFTRLGAALDKSSLDYNPTNELIFPSIRHVAGRVRNPLGKWYMYYAPHDDPGGICLAYADSLEGPWHEYAHNPIITNDWRGHFSVPHVSSPHAVWNPADRRMYLYFHGNNRTTRVATSVDGRHFVYGGIVLHTDMVGAGLHEASYARVFPHPVKDGIHIMLYMGRQGQTRKIFIGWSHDLASGWKFKREPLITPAAGEGGQLSGAHYWGATAAATSSTTRARAPCTPPTSARASTARTTSASSTPSRSPPGRPPRASPRRTGTSTCTTRPGGAGTPTSPSRGPRDAAVPTGRHRRIRFPRRTREGQSERPRARPSGCRTSTSM